MLPIFFLYPVVMEKIPSPFFPYFNPCHTILQFFPSTSRHLAMDKLLNLSDEAVICILPSEGYFKGEFSEGTKSTNPVTTEHRVPGHVTLRRAFFAAMCHACSRGQRTAVPCEESTDASCRCLSPLNPLRVPVASASLQKMGGPTLSAILTKRLNPSEDLRSRRLAMFWQKSLALVLDSTSKA